MTEVYNPLDKKHLGRSVADALLASPALPLADLTRFAGAGIYALYYAGPFPLYARIARRNVEGRFGLPIYVGKATPPGRRVGEEVEQRGTTALYQRLGKHAQSLEQARNLDVADFYYRALVVDDIWIPLGESLLITRFAPLWNQFVDGFGNNDPGGGRRLQRRSRWDVLHPGRPYADLAAERSESLEQIMMEVEGRLATMLD